jgi:heptaprenyl diphosphate synthase
MKTTTKKLVYISILVAQAMVLSWLESLIPFTPGIPGAKLGLANIVTLMALSTLDFKSTLTIVLMRTTLTSFMFGTMSSLLYSISGGLLSLIVMAILLKVLPKSFSLVAISILGAIAHNLGQLMMAALVIENANILYYLPFLMILAIPTGLFVGIVTRYLLPYLKRSGFQFQEN